MMISTFGVYTGDGQISRMVFCGEDEGALQAKEGEYVLVVPDDQADMVALNSSNTYVNNGEFMAKQALALSVDTWEVVADGIDTATISNIPIGTTVRWHDGLVEEVTDGLVEMATDLPGTYTLTFSAIPYLTQEVTIEAIPAT